MRAAVLVEHDRADEARRSLEQVLYLDQDFILAHFVLATLAQSDGRHAEARRHFANALRLLRRRLPDEILPESDGLTAGRLVATITAITGPESRA